jgi:hypothetical protein
MRFALLIYSAETDRAKLSEKQMNDNMGAWFTYTDEMRESGKMLGGEALMPTATAHTVKRGPGRPVSDGPFAETKEQLGGFYLVEADTWQEAAEWAKKMPIVEGGSIEVRPLMEFDQ